MQRRSFITMNSEAHWRAGFCDKMEIAGGCLTPAASGGVSRGVWYSPAFDSRERDFEWTRLTLEGQLPENTLISVGVCSSNVSDPGGVPIKRLLREGRAQELDALFEDRYEGADLLLSCRGRYLWVRLELVFAESAPLMVRAVRVQYQGDHMADYLPACYRLGGRESFVWRFLSIFDSLSLDLEEAIYHTASLFDVGRAQGEMLRFLASWVAADVQGLEDSQLREEIFRTVRAGSLAQTPRGIRALVKLWTKSDPILLEHWQVEDMIKKGRDRALYSQLYGSNPNQFFLLMEETAFRSPGEADRLLEHLERALPANVTAKLVLLRKSTYLDWHTYLGINSGIGGYAPASIDESAAIRYDTMIGGDDHDKSESVSD